jgi:hypothetical protein
MNWTMFILGWVGGAIATGILTFAWLWSKPGFSRIRQYVHEREEYADFRKMPNPPDEGIEQRIYKPRGTPAEVSRSALGRRHPKP